MPKLEKRILSQYLRVRCDRFLHHSLFRSDPQEHIPLPLAGRPGVQAFKDRGLEFESKKKEELATAFGDRYVDAEEPAKRSKSPDSVIKRLLVDRVAGPHFLVEPPLGAGMTRLPLLKALAIKPAHFPDFPDFRPDLIMVLPVDDDRFRSRIEPGGTVLPIAADDTRARLRVIDMKATEKLNPSYAAEVVAYSMVLAAWLEGMSLSDSFVVVATPAVWAKSVLFTLDLPNDEDSVEEKLLWLDTQLLDAESELYSPPVVKFLSEDIPRVLGVSDWKSLDWGVAPTCSQCDYLGYPPWTRGVLKKAQRLAKKLRWSHEPQIDGYCYGEATDNGLAMQIPSLTVGMRRALNDEAVTRLSDVADRDPKDPIFSAHHGLRREAHRLPPKADAILSETSETREHHRNAQMAGYADLRLTINVSFDASSQLLIGLGLGIDYREPSPFGQPRKNPLTRKQVSSFLVDSDDLETEREELVDCLRTISATLDWIADQGAYAPSPGDPPAKQRAEYAKSHARVQVVFWDRRQEEALRQAIGRHLMHLHALGVLPAAIWLFPPEEVVRSDKTAETPPACYLKDALTNLYVLPTTISDDVVSIAESLVGFDARLSDFDWDRIGGSIPKERALEIWQVMPPKRPPKSLSECRKQYQRTLETLTHAMRQLTFHAVINEKEAFCGKAPLVSDLLPTAFQSVAADALLWLTHLAVEEGVGRLETKMTFSADPYETESTFAALRTAGHITGRERADLLRDYGLGSSQNRRVFRIRDESVHVKFRNGEKFLALIPEEPVGSALMRVGHFVDACGAHEPDYDEPQWSRNRYVGLHKILGATLRHFDREQLVAVIDLDDYFDREECRSDLATCGALNYDEPMMLCKTYEWSILEKITQVARAIGNPPIAVPAAATGAALARVRKPGRSAVTPAAEVLWKPSTLVRTGTGVDVDASQSLLEELAGTLPDSPNDSQLAAVRDCLGRRLNLVWGGPGTGKTTTLLLAILADALSTHPGRDSSRSLVSTFSYRALSEIIARLDEWVPTLPKDVLRLLKTKCRLSFFVSSGRAEELGVLDNVVGGLKTVVFEGASHATEDGRVAPHLSREVFREDLEEETEGRIEIVFAPSHQVLNLAHAGQNSPVAPLFDRVWIDESSQLSVAHSLALFALLDDAGAVGVFGDRLQMPPVQRIAPPRGAEDMVSGIQGYLLSRIGEQETAEGSQPKYRESFLRINYRSCEPIVAFSRAVGYEASFEAYHHDRRLRFDDADAETDWDTDVVPDLPLTRRCLNPELPCVAVTYDDGRNGQANEFEARLVAACLLQYRSAEAWQADFSEKNFWAQQVGVVTPHRAQRSTIVSLLQSALEEEDVDRDWIEGAVDTVERFQGGERDLVLISFGLGDPDLIQKEEEFLFQKERMNVAITRAKSKVILFVTRDLGLHLPEDARVTEASKTLKHFVYHHAINEFRPESMNFNGRQVKNVIVRYRTYDD